MNRSAWEVLTERKANLAIKAKTTGQAQDDQLTFALFLVHEYHRHVQDLEAIRVDLESFCQRTGLDYRELLQAGFGMGRFEF